MRPGPWATASELERALQCPASCVLPRTGDSDTEAAIKGREWGHSVHHWKATNETFPELLSRGRGDRYVPRLDCLETAGLTRDVLWPGGDHEVTYVYQDGKVTRHAASLEVNSLPARATKGTADWLSTVPIVWVDDLKTGKAAFEEAAPDQRPQLLFYGMCAAMDSDLRDQDSILLSVTRWPKYPREGVPTRSTDLIPVSRLTTFRAELDEARELALSPGAEDVTRPGNWCTFCKSKSFCPEFR